MVDAATKRQDSTRRPCAATTRGGAPCRNAALAGGDFCFFHDPARRGDVVAAARKGGHNRRRRPTAAQQTILVQTLADAVALLADEITQARAVSEPGLARLRAIAYSLLTWAKLYETGELAARIAALEAALSQRQEVQK